MIIIIKKRKKERYARDLLPLLHTQCWLDGVCIRSNQVISDMVS